MEIYVTGVGLSITHALRTHVLARLGNALDCVSQKVERIHVRLSDVNGPHGGVDKRCHVDVYSRRLRPVILTEVANDMYVAIDRAIGRAKTVLLRQIGKRKQNGPRQPGGDRT